jgi:Tol biopolymer transport system component
VYEGNSVSRDAEEVWTAGADGSTPQQLTHGPGRWQGSPHWSPDGRQVAFDSLAADGSWHIWTIAADGGVPRQVTTDQGSQNVPTWSRDGDWIYYSWEQNKSRDTWRIRPADGRKQRLTPAGSRLDAHESPDGKRLIYGGPNRSLFEVPLAGGPPHQIVACVDGWTTASTGLYYVACAPGSGAGRIQSRAAPHRCERAGSDPRHPGTILVSQHFRFGGLVRWQGHCLRPPAERRP